LDTTEQVSVMTAATAKLKGMSWRVGRRRRRSWRRRRTRRRRSV